MRLPLIRLLQMTLRSKAVPASLSVFGLALFTKGAVPTALHQLLCTLPPAPHLLFFYLTSALILLFLNRTRAL